MDVPQYRANDEILLENLWRKICKIYANNENISKQ